jgi:thioredoxin reductase (NADPH)
MQNQTKSYDVMIIGAGPAGVQAAQSLAVYGFQVLIVEKNSCAGGLQLNNPYINRWLACAHNKRGEDFVEAMNLNLQQPGIDFHTRVTGVTLEKTENSGEFILSGKSTEGEFCGSASKLILATGVRPRAAGFIPSDRLLIGPGKQIDNGYFVDEKIAILGGGDNAFENYGFLKEKRAKSIKIFSRSLRARVAMIHAVPKTDIFLGEYMVDSEKLTVNGEKFDRICVFYGWEASVPFDDVLQLQKNQKNYIRADAYGETSHPNVFAIGEITTRVLPSFVTAMAEGMIVAKRIQELYDQAKVALLEAELRNAGAVSEHFLQSAKHFFGIGKRKYPL